ncbi:MAG: CoA transferase, partial [Actinomycetota bacterium]
LHDALPIEQARDAGCLVDVPMSDGTTETMVASPVDFGRDMWSVREPSPELGQHTELVLAEIGVDWDDIEALKSQGVIP